MSLRHLIALFVAAFLGAAHAQAPKPEAAKPEAELPQVKIVQEIFSCMSAGLPPEWKIAWVTVAEVGRSVDGKSRNFEAVLRFSSKEGDLEGEELKPCDSGKIVQGVGDLNEFLKPEERTWTAALIAFSSEGKFEVKYDYTPVKYADGKPTAKPAIKPGAKPAAKTADDAKKSGFKLGQ